MYKKTQRNAVIVFVKFPDEGKVKTRLAKTTGNKFATAFYKLCAQHTFRELKKLPEETIQIYIFFDGNNISSEIKSWANSVFLFRPQFGKNLGEKMYTAFREIFKVGYEKVVIIGTDLPDISSEIIIEAFTAMEKNDAVIGPSTDGGFYLLGLKSITKEFFTNIEWSTHSVLKQTTSKLLKANLKVQTLTELIDIDTENDLRNWMSSRKQNECSTLFSKIESIYTP